MPRLKGHQRTSRQARLKDQEAKAMWDSKLVILQANVMRSLKRLRHIFHHALNSKGRPPDIIAIQDPPNQAPWGGCYHYEVDLKPARPLKETDNPVEQKDVDKRVALAKVCFYVHKSIPKDQWTVRYHENDNKTLAATLELSTTAGEMAIHNLYNHRCTVNIDQFIGETTASRRDIIVGDFNLHHPRWSGALFKPKYYTRTAGRLHDGMVAAQMRCLTTPGTVTYTRGKRQDETSSCIDLTFISEDMASRVLGCAVKKIDCWDESDHRPIQTSLNIEVSRDDSKRYLWKKTPEKRYLAALATVLEDLDGSGHEPMTREEANATGAALVDGICRVMEECVPSRPAAPACIAKPSQPASVAVRSVVENEKLPTEIPNPRKGARWTRFWNRWAKRVLEGEPNDRVGSWRRFVPAKAKNTRGVYQMAKLAKRLCQPKDKGRIPPLVSGGLTFVSEEEKGRCFEEAIWPLTSHGDLAPPLPLPNFGSDGLELQVDQSLEEDEVDRLIRGLPSGKSAGDDGIANEALKLGRAVLVPVLTKLFRACLKLSHHPKHFKHAVTVILLKEGKEVYSDPKSWRPIALLPSLGKLLEKIIADRLKNLAIEHNLLPRSQYGAAGRSTCSAVQDMLHPVYKAWTRKMRRAVRKKATLLGLDISGAFDNIDREKLLEILIEKGLPAWLVVFIWSFLSCRSTVLKMPGSTTEPFFVNIGIPQGSPLSPILFLFFAAPILELIDESTRNGVTIHAFAYVDDTYLLAVSNSYAANCKRLEEVHDDILRWSGPAGVTFSPHKYNVMHFKYPRSREPDCLLLPNIPGLDTPEQRPRTTLKILGIVEKVDKQLRYLRRISGTIWGLNLQATRQYYLTKIRPTITYACAAWFMYSPNQKLNWAISCGALKRLDDLQYRCLKQVSGALGSCSARVLEKELHIDSMRVFLYRLMLAQRAKSLQALGQLPYVQPVHVTPTSSSLKAHPCQILDKEAQGLCDRAWKRLARYLDGNPDQLAAQWLNPKRRKRTIDKCAIEEAEKRSAEVWDDYRRDRARRHSAERHRPRALEEGWGLKTFKYYKGLSRAQSTMLLQCRTEFIGLNGFLHARKLAASAACSCGHPNQTVFHMFVHCKDLSKARAHLKAKVRETDFETLMTQHTAVAADWAITYFNLDQFYRLVAAGAALLGAECRDPTVDGPAPAPDADSGRAGLPRYSTDLSVHAPGLRLPAARSSLLADHVDAVDNGHEPGIVVPRIVFAISNGTEESYLCHL
ncbi:hypothetical protein ACJ41O_010434 [Fusarium nematophilum]